MDGVIDEKRKIIKGWLGLKILARGGGVARPNANVRGECSITSIDRVEVTLHVNNSGKREVEEIFKRSVGLRGRGAEEVYYPET